MPSMPDITKRNLSVQIPREMYYQIKRAARDHKLDLAVYVRMLLSEAVIDVELTEADYVQIAKEIRDAKIKRKNG